MDRNISKTLLESGKRLGGGDKTSGRRLLHQLASSGARDEERRRIQRRLSGVPRNLRGSAGVVNSRVPTTQLQSASKFLWRPDLRPRLVEYVAHFARAGERALGEREKTRTLKNEGCGTHARQHQTLPGLRDRFAAPDNTRHAGQRGSRQFPRASWLIPFPHVLPRRRGV
jgi:hypothetical protein